VTNTDLRNTRKVLFAKTSLDGHWRGPLLVTGALEDAGFDVMMLGMATPEETAAAALRDKPDLIGLNICGHIDVVKRTVAMLREQLPETPIFAGGTVAPWAKKELEAIGVEVYPPGSKLKDIVAAAHRLTEG